MKLPRGSELVAGIGDDCAIVRPLGAREDLLFTTDLLLENVHFRRATHPPEVVGRKALARGLSDLAAMGGEPRFCLLSLVAPQWADHTWIRRFYDGLLEFSEQTHTPLAGGDLARGKNFACDIVVAGAVPRGQALLRSGAKPGDSIYVSGALGGSALGLRTKNGPAAPEARTTARTRQVFAPAASRYSGHGFERWLVARSAPHVPGFGCFRGNRTAPGIPGRQPRGRAARRRRLRTVVHGFPARSRSREL